MRQATWSMSGVRGAGYGLEIPYTYRFYGPKAYIDRITEITESLHASTCTLILVIEPSRVLSPAAHVS